MQSRQPDTPPCPVRDQVGIHGVFAAEYLLGVILVRARTKPIFGACLTVALVGLLPLLGCGREPGMQTRCIDNLRQIEGAKKQWMTEARKATNDVATWDDIRPYLHQSRELHCPKGGVYTLGKLDASPTCSIGGEFHKLP